ncbi:DNA polymerase III subunit beta [Candidatus Azobacteroides pseudotrichonymphae]|uniref:Beta sliding clamp n=1 Tax=Azobacteroides pseudotrichonymphae genomovar. CFP2 TaxID=511995 RepID=B6YRT5_AZOPC|nr:DNA polymerase III subunit beta [Candidatus Azobacteroides pseudotrichonymphae]BAG83907.1 DNA polymerase III beta subunit [Candidatus Azobacteroides pseudotrichonymphae genomovar. CFP2]
MKFIIPGNVLLGYLQTVGKVIATKNIIPILDCFLFQLSDNQLTITGADAETRITTTSEVLNAEGEGKFAIPSKNLLDALRELPDQPITFVINETNNEVLIYYENGKYSFIAQNGDEYPTSKPLQIEVHELIIKTKDLLNGISSTLFASAHDELRPVMNSIFFDMDPERVIFVASDGHKLVRLKNSRLSGNKSSSFILPRKPANLLRTILLREEGETVINFDLNYIHIILPHFTLISRLIEGHYPNYNAVIPNESPYRIIVDRLNFLNALKRVTLFSNPGNSLIKLQILANKIFITAQDIDYSIAAEELVLCNYEGNEITIGFKGTYLIEMLNNISSNEIIFELADVTRAGLILPKENKENEDLLMLLMPMMLKE